MKKKLTLGIFVIVIVLNSLSIETQSTTTSFKSENQSTGFTIFSLSPTSSKFLDLSLTPHEPIEIINDGNFTDYGFLGYGNDTHPFIIEGYNITTTSGNGIYIKDTTKYFLIRDCYVDASIYGIFIENIAEGTASIINNTCSNNAKGIYLYYSSGATLTNNTCISNSWDGIYLYYSSGATITNNTCNTNNGDCIYLYSSSGATLTNNTCTNGEFGIYLSDSYETTITINTCTNNYFHSIYLYSSSGATITNNTCTNSRFSGIYLSDSSDSTITNNTCTFNNDYGIRVIWSYFCAITSNFLQENEEYGISLEVSSDNNIIHHNTFEDNNIEGSSQALDECENNIWYDANTNEGNYWSDWSGKGSYPIDGEADSIDPYPLNEEGNPPTVSEFAKKSGIIITLFLCSVLIPLLLRKKRT